MIQITVAIGDVCTDVVTDQILSFDGIETILNRATHSTLQAYNSYVVVNEEYEALTEDDK
jgi:hypothetical protein